MKSFQGEDAFFRLLWARLPMTRKSLPSSSPQLNVLWCGSSRLFSNSILNLTEKYFMVPWLSCLGYQNACMFLIDNSTQSLNFYTNLSLSYKKATQYVTLSKILIPKHRTLGVHVFNLPKLSVPKLAKKLRTSDKEKLTFKTFFREETAAEILQYSETFIKFPSSSLIRIKQRYCR